MPRESPTRRAFRRSYPDLTFWYGLSPAEIMAMPRWALREYMDNLDRLKAEQETMMVRAVSYPNLKKASQNKARRDLRRRMNYGADKRAATKPKTKGEMARHLAGIGIGFVTE